LFLDGDGRVTLPMELMEAAHIAESATFVGLGRKFQIWDPKMFEQRRNEARREVQAQKLTVPKFSQGCGA